ncbi:MAG TPA: D-alanyl-D-alanine carboxypeptidase/D-alanyl-D-alanine-endopeptidase [Jatrophihabitans sp.]|jgi:D-alanyl-D-alanine carboxypeptidase/D-alanyl-D-alanine-endopeptidase (penicillin-binding protein 4)
MGRRWWATAVVVVLVIAAAFVAGYAVTRVVHRATAAPAPPHPSLPPALSAVTAAPTTAPSTARSTSATPAGVREAIGALAKAPGLGGRLLARVIDAHTGKILFDGRGNTPAAPASTGKLLTAAAMFAVHEPGDRLTTKIVSTGDGTVYLVGGGDPTLAAAAPGKPSTYAGAARISDLVTQLHHAHVAVHRIVVDGSLFAGPSIAPSWDRTDIGTSYAAPITAVMSDAAVIAPPGYARSTEPDLDAGAALAKLLGDPKLSVTQGKAPAGAKVVASVRSAPVSELIDEMLQTSDNVIADVLARQVAIAEHQPASFTGAVTAIRTVLGRLGVHVGSGMKDGSGLSSADRVSPAALVGVLRLVGGADTTAPKAAAQLHLIASMLPVAGWSGTLELRYTAGAQRYAAGRIRAKTGTLSTVSSLAGLVRDRTGALLAFSFDADRAIGTYGAEAALDALATRLTRCGCN